MGRSNMVRLFLGYDSGRKKYFEIKNSNHQNTMILGAAGSGKTTMMHNMIYHMLSDYTKEQVEIEVLNIAAYNEFAFWETKGVRVKRISLYENEFEKRLKEHMEDLESILNQRFDIMHNNGWKKYMDIPDSVRFPRLIIFIPNFDVFMNSIRELQSEYLIDRVLRLLLRIGSIAGIHFVVEGQTIRNNWVDVLESFRKAVILYNHPLENHVFLATLLDFDQEDYDCLRANVKDLVRGEAVVYDYDEKEIGIRKIKFPECLRKHLTIDR